MWQGECTLLMFHVDGTETRRRIMLTRDGFAYSSDDMAEGFVCDA